MKAKIPPYKIVFADIAIKPIVPTEKDKYLALASVENLRAFIPEINLEKNIDLVPVAFNACVVNRMNKNADGITTAIALDMFDGFINKPINTEHDRTKVIGAILSASFSEFGTDKPLTKEECAKMTGPYNITLGGVVWRAVNEDIAAAIEESNDPTSPYYLKISASWELGFYDYVIAELPKDSKNLEDATYVEDPEEVKKLEASLRAFGGTGLRDDKVLCRVPKGEVIALGIGFTEAPAAEVQGIAVPEALVPKNVKAEEVKPDTTAALVETTANNDVKENISSQSNNLNVKKDSLTMKITATKDITDESLKTIAASEIVEFISNQIKQANDQYVSEKATAQDALTKAKAEYDSLVAENTKTKADLEEIQKTLKKLTEEAKARELQEKFDIHMGLVAEKFELDDETTKIVAGQIQGLSDEDFEKYEKTLSVLLKGKEKKAPIQAKASEDKTTADIVVSDAVDNGDKKTVVVPNTPAGQTSVAEQWKNAFGESGWDFKPNRRK